MFLIVSCTKEFLKTKKGHECSRVKHTIETKQFTWYLSDLVSEFESYKWRRGRKSGNGRKKKKSARVFGSGKYGLEIPERRKCLYIPASLLFLTAHNNEMTAKRLYARAFGVAFLTSPFDVPSKDFIIQSSRLEFPLSMGNITIREKRRDTQSAKTHNQISSTIWIFLRNTYANPFLLYFFWI